MKNEDSVDEQSRWKRSTSLGVRNQSFKTSNLSLIREKQPKIRKLNNSESAGIRSVQKNKISKIDSLGNRYHTKVVPKNSDTSVVKHTSQRRKLKTKLPSKIPLPKRPSVKRTPVAKTFESGLSIQTRSILKMKGMSIATIADFISEVENASSNENKPNNSSKRESSKVTNLISKNEE